MKAAVPDLKKILARRLRYTRRSLRGLSQTEVSTHTGIPTTSISKFESLHDARMPSLENLTILSDFLEVSIDYLIGKSLTYDKSIIDGVDSKFARLTKSNRNILRHLMVSMLKEQENATT